MSAFDGFDAFQRILQESSNTIEDEDGAVKPDETLDSSSDTGSFSSSSPSDGPRPRVIYVGRTYDLPYDLVRVTRNWRLPEDKNLDTGRFQTVICEHLQESSKKWAPLQGREYKPVLMGPLSSAQRPHIPRDCSVAYLREFDTIGRKITEKLAIKSVSRVAQFIQKRTALPTSRTRNHIILQEDQFKDLFFMKEVMRRHLKDLDKDAKTIQSSGFKQILQFLDHMFPLAESERNGMKESGELSFDFLWTLFPPGRIVYECRRAQSFVNHEQCLMVRRIEERYSHGEGSRYWHLALEEVVCRPGTADRTHLVTTQRQIQYFEGTLKATTDNLAVVPVSLMALGVRTALYIRLSQLGRRYMSLCMQGPSMWDYEGLVRGPRNLFGVRIGEQTHAPSDKRLWQTYVKEKVAIDVVNSENVLQRDYGDDIWLDEHHHTAEAESRPFRVRSDGSSEDAEISAIDIDDYHIICRNDIAAYLLSSRREAVGIQISQLKAAVWDENKWNRTLIRQPDLHTVCNVWKSLVESILSSQTSSDRLVSHREPFDSKSGLVMLLHGPRKLARNVALGMAESLHRPLVIVTDLSRLQNLSYCALRWSGILLVEAAERLQHLEYEGFTEYPGIVLLTTDKLESVFDSSYEAIDVVIDLEKPGSSHEDKLLRSKSGKLWYEYLVDELPEWIETFGEEELQSISERLASHEKREVRMSKVISTAKMLAQLKNEAVREEHLIQVVRQCTAFDQRIDTRKEE